MSEVPLQSTFSLRKPACGLPCGALIEVLGVGDRCGGRARGHRSLWGLRFGVGSEGLGCRGFGFRVSGAGGHGFRMHGGIVQSLGFRV